jgi:hypothetical protein
MTLPIGRPPFFSAIQYSRLWNDLTGMDTTLSPDALMTEQNKRVAETVSKERGRRRVADPCEAEDILQDVFFEFMEAYRLPEPIEQVGAWHATSSSTASARRMPSPCRK